ncbi:MAG TPA: prepilin-type N-terminal cleavage/methylation domain-containing protein [bacterium]
MNARIPSVSLAAQAHGFSLIEVLVALGIFAVVCVGVLSVLGATAAGGFLDAAPTSLTTGRHAKDLTVAAVYLQALHDYLATQDDAVWSALLSTWPSGTDEQIYCLGSGGASCGGGEPTLPAALGSYPLPQSAPYQLTSTTLRVVVQRWHWDCATTRYAVNPALATPDLLVRVYSTLVWRFKGEPRTVTTGDGGVDRFLPYGSPVPAPSDEVCP